MKHPHYAFSKKLLPAGSLRITNEQGLRVWVINGKQYTSKRAYFKSLAAKAKKTDGHGKVVEVENFGEGGRMEAEVEKATAD